MIAAGIAAFKDERLSSPAVSVPILRTRNQTASRTKNSTVASLCAFTHASSSSNGFQAKASVAVFAMGPGLVRTVLTEYQLESPEGRRWLPGIQRAFEEGRDVPPTRAAALAAALASGRFDRLAGRAFSIEDDLKAILANEAEILGKDQKTLRFR